MIVVIIGITLVYLFWIGSFIVGLSRIKTSEISGLQPKTRFSVIVPFRNEEDHLTGLLESMVQLNYPKEHFEFIFVNDASEDQSVAILQSFITSLGITAIDVTLLDNVRRSNSSKKDAITLAISQAKYDWIVTTDADGILPRYWLDSFDEFIQKHHPNFIAAPVTYTKTRGFLQHFQLLDVLSLQGATMGGFGLQRPFLCNGANLAYKKQLFITVDGFEGNSTIASGDDVFLLEKALRINGDKVRYLKSRHAVVATSVQTSLAGLMDQRVRWASKTSAYRHVFGKLTGLLILAENMLLLCCLFLMIGGLLSYTYLMGIMVLKFGIDFILIYRTAHFFEQRYSLKYYPLAAICYPFFTCYVAFIALFIGYRWKDRHYRK